MSLNRSAPCILTVSFLCACAAPAADPHAGEVPLDIGIEKPMIDLGLVRPAECRRPSRMAPDVATADAELPCRQLKIVQHHLAGMLDISSYLAAPAELGDEFAELDDPDDRRQYYFGTYWLTYQTSPAFSLWTHEQRLAAFEADLRRTFPRMMAVLIASTHPTDIDDGGDDWWWELPWVYSNETDVKARAQMMRDDVNGWIRDSGLHMLRNVGTADDFGNDDDPDEHLAGDFDFVLIELVSFLYQFRDRSDLLTDESVWTLLHKGWADHPLDVLVPAGWTETNIPVSGQDFAAALWFGGHVGVDDYSFAETENHVLMTMAHFYLINQWVSRNYRGNLVGSQAPHPPAGWTAATWWAPDSAALIQQIRDVTGRVVHSGMFEDNARPYQQLSYLALLALATHAEDEAVAVEAQNALHFLATTFTFQSLDGRRWTSMRRNCEYAARLDMYVADGLSAAIGVLSGAYKWNDSPYGYKRTREAGGFDACLTDPECHWRTYSFKVDLGNDDTGGERIPTEAGQLEDDTIRDLTPQARGLFTAFASYRLPRAVHGFLIDKHDGAYARMMPRYDRQHYPFTSIGTVTPEYFDGDHAFDDATFHNEKTPAFYFLTNGYLNASGGMYNPLYGYTETSHIIPANPSGPTCHGDNRMSGYDNVSRPYVVLPQVPAVLDEKGEVAHYEPFGLDDDFDFEHAALTLPMMRGNSDEWFKSVNIATYKNFSYGYRVRDTGPGTWADLGGEFPQDIPLEWDGVPTAEFEIGSARFIVYDLRDHMTERGQEGYFLITARVRKYFVMLWSRRVARGFWEVIPGSMFDDVDAVADAVRAGNDADNFELGYGLFDGDFDYRMVTTGETLRLDQAFGLYLRDVAIVDEGATQGIIGVRNADGSGTELETSFVEIMMENHTNRLPLIDVKEVGPDYNFALTRTGRHRYYACAQDGWICVNNRHDNSYLWVDSRRGAPSGDAPYWEHGTFDGSPDTWGCSCGSGGGGWTPGPPDNGRPDDCSDPDGCGEREPGRPGDPDEPGDCVDCPLEPCQPAISCTSDSQCPSGQCDEREDVCLCQDDGAEPCERSSFTPCVPEMPACGPGEMCLPGANGETRCQCPACEGSSGESCGDGKPCVDPAETCIGIDRPGDVGECACVLR